MNMRSRLGHTCLSDMCPPKSICDQYREHRFYDNGETDLITKAGVNLTQ